MSASCHYDSNPDSRRVPFCVKTPRDFRTVQCRQHSRQQPLLLLGIAVGATINRLVLEGKGATARTYVYICLKTSSGYPRPCQSVLSFHLDSIMCAPSPSRVFVGGTSRTCQPKFES